VKTLLRVTLVAAGLAFAGTAHAASNIVLIVTDDQRADTLDAMPTVLAELGAKGAVYPDSFVVNSNCCPSRVATLTGLYSHSNGFYRQNSNSTRVSRAFSQVPQLATWLHAAGYRTALVGKYLNGYDGSFAVPGWDRFVTLLHPIDYFGYTLYRDGVLEPRGSGPLDYSTDVLAAEAETFIRGVASTTPLFLYFTPNAPHSSLGGVLPKPAPRHEPQVVVHDPPSLGEDVSDKPEWVQRLGLTPPPHDPSLFLGAMRTALSAVDEGVGRLLTALEETGRLSDTLVIFTSDNGLMLNEHGLGIRKRVPYEESIRVPFVMRYDGHAFAPRMVANIDIAPTIMEAVGLPFAGDGSSLLSGEGRAELLIENVGKVVPTYCALRTRTAMYAAYTDGSQELYDLAADPFQLNNRTAREARYDMRRRLAPLCRPVPPGFRWPQICTRSGDRRANVIRGTRAFDVVCAGPGNDLVQVRDGRRDVVICGPGRDRVDGDRVDEVRPDCERVQRHP